LASGRLQERLAGEWQKQFVAAFLRPLPVEKSPGKLDATVTTVTSHFAMSLFRRKSVEEH
jgi:hypothetical protein